jgi:hypothetical protein
VLTISWVSAPFLDRDENVLELVSLTLLLSIASASMAVDAHYLPSTAVAVIGFVIAIVGFVLASTIGQLRANSVFWCSWLNFVDSHQSKERELAQRETPKTNEQMKTNHINSRGTNMQKCFRFSFGRFLLFSSRLFTRFVVLWSSFFYLIIIIISFIGGVSFLRTENRRVVSCDLVERANRRKLDVARQSFGAWSQAEQHVYVCCAAPLAPPLGCRSRTASLSTPRQASGRSSCSSPSRLCCRCCSCQSDR